MPNDAAGDQHSGPDAPDPRAAEARMDGIRSGDARAGNGKSPVPLTTRRNRVATEGDRSHRILMMVLRSMFVVALISVFVLTVSGTRADGPNFGFSTILGLLIASAAFGLIIILIDALTPNKRLAWLVGIFVGTMIGLVGAAAIGFVLDLVVSVWGTDNSGRPLISEESRAYLGLAKVSIGLVLIYLSVSVVLTTRDDFRLVIPYVEFAKQTRGARPLLFDTSALIDGRIDEISRTGIIDAPVVVAQFVIDELHALADSQDRQKRQRGRRGLDVLQRLQSNPYLDLEIEDLRTDGRSVDRALVEIATLERFRIVTTDSGLEKVAQINGVAVLNLNSLAIASRSGQTPGDSVQLQVVKRGENPRQGVGYLEDGTMIVVDDGAPLVGRTINAVITNAVQTAAGRLLFARADELPESGPAAPAAPTAPASSAAPAADASRPPDAARVSNASPGPPGPALSSDASPAAPTPRQSSMGRAATHQPRTPTRPSRSEDEDGTRGRNPRR
ncbi:MAG: hypothetical protein JNK53_05655 [Phycisphaerae bacterium]|nr:hypothetical protein [Phycisphaerae bacterium]